MANTGKDIEKREREREREWEKEEEVDRESQAASGERKEQAWYGNVRVYFAKEKRGRSNGSE